jgi:hypothetical protein
MSTFIYRQKEEFCYKHDVLRIVEAFANMGHTISEIDAQLAWEEHSDDLCAGWLILPDTDREIMNALIPYLEEYSCLYSRRAT